MTFDLFTLHLLLCIKEEGLVLVHKLQSTIKLTTGSYDSIRAIMVFNLSFSWRCRSWAFTNVTNESTFLSCWELKKHTILPLRKHISTLYKYNVTFNQCVYQIFNLYDVK